jgi:hypothetical protein
LSFNPITGPSTAQLVWLDLPLRCAGTEDRLLDCFLGDDAFNVGADRSDNGGPPFGGPPVAPPPGQFDDPCIGEKLAVVCRTFEIEGTALLLPLNLPLRSSC